MKTLILIVFVLLPAKNAFAQTEEEIFGNGKDLSLNPIDESMLEENVTSTFILDNTKTKVGRDLYDEFYRKWSSLQLDSTSTQKLNISLAENNDMVIEIEEVPSPGLSNMVVVKVDQVVVWQQFVQTRVEILELQSEEAVQEVVSHFISLKEVQDQLGSKDQLGTGIY